MAQDPVCGMDEKGCTFHTEHKGSPTTSADPERYIAPLEETKEEGEKPGRL
ncbi:MAG: hypothetical protein ACE5LG_02235 [Anaerolineae bacterium]